MGPRPGDPLTLYVDVERLAPDADALDALARVALLAQRHGCHLALCHVQPALRDLIELAGLTDVLLRPRSTGPIC